MVFNYIAKTASTSCVVFQIPICCVMQSSTNDVLMFTIILLANYKEIKKY